MGELRFEWDPAKDASNPRKHGIAFAEAETVFSEDDVIRLISARKATRPKRAQYTARWQP